MRRIAIVGTGIAGLGCAYFLHKHFDLTIFEQCDHAGGHVHTLTVDENGRSIPIDTGFMVYNEITYPGLTRLFRDLNVPSRPTSMSFAVRHSPLDLEYCGSSLNCLFGQRRNLWNIRFIRMLVQVNRFNREAADALTRPECESQTLGSYVAEKKYGADFLNLYLIPMSAAVWSTPPSRMLDFPALTLLRFFHNHGFLGLHTQHPWFTIPGGAKNYVNRLIAPFRERIRLGCGVSRVSRSPGGVSVTTKEGETRFDAVILACHADQSLNLLADPTPAESRLLGEFRYQRNVALLHTDESVMPKTMRCWASWNYRIDAGESGDLQPSTHYWMNSLQGVSDRKNYFVSLNAARLVDSDKILRTVEFDHPMFSLGAVRAQTDLPDLNRGAGRTTYFCGSYFRYGFHEDAFDSAVRVAGDILGRPVWS